MEELFTVNNLKKSEYKGIKSTDLAKIWDKAISDKINYLDISHSRLTGIIEIPALKELKILDISYNEAEIDQLIIPAGLNNLEYLYLYDSQIKSIKFLGSCPALDTLHLGKNNLAEFKLSAQFLNLVSLRLEENNLQEFDPEIFTQAPKLEFLKLYNNPLRNVLAEMLDDENDKMNIEDLKNLLKKGEKDYIRQAKLILIGNGEVGKTSIRIKLLDKKAPLPEKNDRSRLLDLDIKPYFVKNLTREETGLEKEIDFKLMVWDFAGQGKYREVQQLFCSRRSIYVFVTKPDDIPDPNDKYYVGFEYWMNMANAFNYDKDTNCHSPVIHVMNQVDNDEIAAKLDYTRKNRRAVFSNIKLFYDISCKTLDGFDRFEKGIRTILLKESPDILSGEIHKKWLDIKTEIENRSMENYFSIEKYYNEICKDISQSEANTLLNILEIVGTVIYFGQHEILKNWIIINPHWIKNAVCQVMDSELVEEGTFKEKYKCHVWNEYEVLNKDTDQNKNNKIKYTTDDRDVLFQILIAYGFCYQQDDITYIVPSCLPDVAPDLSEIGNPFCKIRFDYSPFIPAGTVNKLMVKLHKKIYRKNLQWFNNFVAEEKGLCAHISESWKDKSVFVTFYNNTKNSNNYDFKELYELIKNNLEEINKELKKTKYIHELEIDIKAEYENKFYSIADLKIFKMYEKEEYKFLFDRKEHSFGEKLLQSDRNNSKRPLIYKPRYIFYGALPFGRLQFPSEHDDFENQLKKLHKDGNINLLHSLVDTNYEKLLTSIRDDKPEIIFFSGHGNEDGIVLKNNESSVEEFLSNEQLKQLIASYDCIKFIFFNCCKSYAQAKIVSENGIYAFGYSQSIDTDLAYSLSIRFFSTFAYNNTPEFCIEDGIYKGMTNVMKNYNDLIKNKNSGFRDINTSQINVENKKQFALWYKGKEIDYNDLK